MPGLIAATIFAFTTVAGAQFSLPLVFNDLDVSAGAAGRHHHVLDQGDCVQLEDKIS